MSPKSRTRPGRPGARALPSVQQASTIIVPLDGSPHALVALPVATTIAQFLKATLQVVHVTDQVLPPRELLRKLGLPPDELPGSVIQPATGPPAASIVRLASKGHSALIVMCTRTGLPGTRGGLGTVADEVLRNAPCPVLLVPPRRGLHPWTVRQVLLPHDGTPTTAEAIGPAADLAHRAGAELAVLHVAAPGPSRPVEPGTFAGPRYVDQPQHEWPAWAHEFLERARGLSHPPAAVKLHLFLARGEPGAEIVRFADEHQSDLIVLAWRGQWDAERAATIKAVISNAPCPLLVLRVEGAG